MPATPERSAEFGVADFGRTLRRRKWVVVITLLVVVAVTVLYSTRQAPVYRSVAGVLLEAPATSTPSGGVAQGSSGSIDIPTQLAIITSQKVQNCVLARIHVAPAVDPVQLPNTSIINIEADAGSPKGAAKIANNYASCYVVYHSTQNTKTSSAAVSNLQAEINKIDAQIKTDQFNLAQLESTGKASTSQINQLNNQIASLNSTLQTYTQQLSTTQLLEQLNKNTAQVLNQAKPVDTAIAPKPLRDGLIALLAGLLLGVGLAFLLEFLDDRIRTMADLERVADGLPVVGVIPDVVDWRNRKEPLLVSLDRPRSTQAEAYRSLRTAVQFMGVEGRVRLLQVTSPVANDGKTSTVANLATAMAMAGQRVVAVSCDLRRPRLHEFFGLGNEVGITSVLLGEATLADALSTEPTEGLLKVLPSGPVPPNPSELLSSQAMGGVLQQLADQADVVIIDSAPVLPVTDAAVLAGRVDAVLIVASAGHSTTRSLSRTLDLLARVNAPVTGMVLNNASGADSYGYGSGSRYRYGYGYGYGYRGYGYSSYKAEAPDGNGAGAKSTNGHPQHAPSGGGPTGGQS